MGVLPLSLEGDPAAAPAVGDELEVPGHPEGLEPGRVLEIRNLTRGNPWAAAHDLTADDIAIIRAGGLLGRLAAIPRGDAR